MDVSRIVAIDIGGTKIASALVTLGDGVPRVEHLASVPTEPATGGSRVLGRVIESAERVLAAAGAADAVGVSSAGVVDPATGAIVYANDIMPGWMGTPLGAVLEERIGLRTRVLNDVHAHALGEARWGAGRTAASVLVAAVGTGIGGAFVERGYIMLGAHGEAGHIGHVCCTDAAGVPCSCGAVGHLEPIAAGPGIIEEYLRLSGAEPGLDGAAVDALARKGDASACAAQERAGRALGEVLGGICNMLDPELVILSGSVAQCGPAWSDALASSFSHAAMPPVAGVPIVRGDLGGDAPLIGAAEHVLRSAYIDVP